MTSPLGFKARVGSALFALNRGVRNIRSLRLTSGETPLPVYKFELQGHSLIHISHYFEGKTLSTNYFEVTVSDLYKSAK